MAQLKLGAEDVVPTFVFDDHGVLIINGWTVAIPHNEMKALLRSYVHGDKCARMNAESGFFCDPDSTVSVHRNGILSYGAAKMAFAEGDLDRVIHWLAEQYGRDF